MPRWKLVACSILEIAIVTLNVVFRNFWSLMSSQDFLAQSAKSWLKSKGIMGSVGAAVLGIALAYQTTGQVSPAESAQLVGIIISAGIAAYGRVVAKRPIKK